jgi:hypothetical protein
MTQHEAFYRRMHAALVAFLVEDWPAIEELQGRFAAHPGSWTRATCCAFYRSAHLHDVFRLAKADFYETAPGNMSKLLWPGGLSASGEDLRRMQQAHEAALRYDATDADLGVEDMTALGHATSLLLISHSGFVRESDRERILEQLAFDVAEDLLGPWPAEGVRSD